MKKSTYHNDLKNLFEDLEDDKAVIRAQEQFLRRFWDGFTMADYPSYGLFSFKHRKTGRFVEEPMLITGLAKSNGLLARYNRWDWDQYFCPNMFSEPKRLKEYARDTRYAWCDVDDANPKIFEPHPSIIWETSLGRSQAIWIWDSKHKPADAEAHSRALTYRHDGDKNGWSVNKLLRIPGSINHKEGRNEHFVGLLHYDETPISERPKPFAIKGRNYGAMPEALEFDHEAFDPTDVLKKYQADLDPKARALIRHKCPYEKNRSAQIFHITVALHEVGASLDEIASVVWRSAYFQDRYPDDLGALHVELSRILSKIGGSK
ncbi:DNA-primase RepB domain-containing protein [uncultured Cohaesibacter sp.]|uniref:DNA-primase RepB domain-containing protein n=1 Tax=uncultured Cohaesibacter sp. TaxID=1002546 RepID=UPI002AAA9684|nr:DNA-primase RepB domain-containing protein [uncultured Cohaesibacter sp.]